MKGSKIWIRHQKPLMAYDHVLETADGYFCERICDEPMAIVAPGSSMWLTFSQAATQKHNPWWSPDLRPHYIHDGKDWMPVLRVGDKVRFEVQEDDIYPRWNFTVDSGGDGNYEIGNVEELRETTFKVDYRHKSMHWNFPNASDKDYPGHGKPGWPQRADIWPAAEVVTPTRRECVECVAGVKPRALAVVPRPPLDGYGILGQDRVWQAQIDAEIKRQVRLERVAPLCRDCGTPKTVTAVAQGDEVSLNWECGECK